MFTRILNFDVATHNRQKGNCLLSALPPEKKKMIDKKKVLVDVETISIYKKEESSAVMILNHFVSFHITHLLIYIKVTQPQPEGFFFVPSRASRYPAVQ